MDEIRYTHSDTRDVFKIQSETLKRRGHFVDQDLDGNLNTKINFKKQIKWDSFISILKLNIQFSAEVDFILGEVRRRPDCEAEFSPHTM